jgi:hypothetical protein
MSRTNFDEGCVIKIALLGFLISLECESDFVKSSTEEKLEEKSRSFWARESLIQCIVGPSRWRSVTKGESWVTNLVDDDEDAFIASPRSRLFFDFLFPNKYFILGERFESSDGDCC